MKAPSTGQQVVSILVMLGLLVFVLLSKDRCAGGVARMFNGLDVLDGGAAKHDAATAIPPRLDAGAPQPPPKLVDPNAGRR